MERFVLDPGLAVEACDRLGVALPADLAGVAALYRAWCASVPFDPVAKALALRRGEVPPGADPADLLERWFATGLGGTCWGHCSSLAGILEVAGVAATVGLDRMVRDDEVVDFHSFVVVADGDRRLALDPVHVSGSPLPLEPGARGDHAVYRTWIEGDGGRLLHRFANPAAFGAAPPVPEPTPAAGPASTATSSPDPTTTTGPTSATTSTPGSTTTTGPTSATTSTPGSTRTVGPVPTGPVTYAVLGLDLDADDVRAFCAVSARFSGVRAQRLFARRCPPGELVQLRTEDDGSLAVHRWTVDDHTVESVDPRRGIPALGWGAPALAMAGDAGLLPGSSGGRRPSP